jgi:hypothetical protein
VLVLSEGLFFPGFLGSLDMALTGVDGMPGKAGLGLSCLRNNVASSRRCVRKCQHTASLNILPGGTQKAQLTSTFPAPASMLRPALKWFRG